MFVPSFADLSSFIGPGEPIVFLQGDPGIGDVILQLSGVDPQPFDVMTVDVELVAFSLESVDPVELYVPQEAFFDVFISLNPDMASTGVMTIRHETEDGGTYDLVLSLHAIKEFVAVDVNGQINDLLDTYLIDVTLTMLGGLWSHTPLPGQETASSSAGFFPVASGLWSADSQTCPAPPTGATCFQIAVSPTTAVPEPGTLGLLGVGLLALGLARRRKA